MPNFNSLLEKRSDEAPSNLFVSCSVERCRHWMARHILKFFDNRPIEELRERGDNDWLLQNENQYRLRYIQRIGSLPQVYCAYDSLPTPIFGALVQVLNWKDVDTYCDNGVPIRFERDHQTIVKPSGWDDGVYKWFRDMLTAALNVPKSPPKIEEPHERNDERKPDVGKQPKPKSDTDKANEGIEAKAKADRKAIEEQVANDTRAYGIASRTDTVAALESYIDKYPNGRFADQARARVKVLELMAHQADDQRHYQAAVKAGTPGALQEYVDSRRDGLFISEAKARIEELQQNSRVTRKIGREGHSE